MWKVLNRIAYNYEKTSINVTRFKEVKEVVKNIGCSLNDFEYLTIKIEK